MNKNIKLSLKEEMEKQALKIEKEVMDSPYVRDLEVTDKMNSDLLQKIQNINKAPSSQPTKS